MQPFLLPHELATELCQRLDAPWPSSFADVATLYRRWCACIPFDTIPKALAIAEGRELPGADAVEVVRTWLTTGAGGTCWGQVNAFAGVLGAAGLPATGGLDRMVRSDGAVDFHAFVVVTGDDGCPHICDFTHVSSRPLRLEGGARGSQGPYETGIDADGGGRLVHWYRTPGHDTAVAGGPAPRPRTRYAVLSTVLDADDVRAFGLVAREFSGVQARRLHSRHFPDGGFVQGRPSEEGRALVLTTWTGTDRQERTIADVDEAFAALGYTTAGRRLAERAGLIEVAADGVHYRR